MSGWTILSKSIKILIEMLNLLDALLPRTRQAVLAEVLLRPASACYLSELARRIGVQPAGLQRELRRLVAAGILTRREDGNRVYYEPAASCPILPDLRGLLTKTVGLADVLRDALRPFAADVAVAFLFGSVARGEERPESDVDVMIVGNPDRLQLSVALSAAREKLLRPINRIVYSPAELGRKFRDKHHFVCNVLEQEQVYLLGSRDDLDAILEGRSGPAAHHQPQ